MIVEKKRRLQNINHVRGAAYMHKGCSGDCMKLSYNDVLKGGE
jgi:hypothetical protein